MRSHNTNEDVFQRLIESFYLYARWNNKKLSYRRDSVHLKSWRFSRLFKVSEFTTNRKHICDLPLVIDGVSRRDDVWAPVSLSISCGSSRLVEPFRRLRFSTVVTIRTSSKCCTPVRQAFCHLDLLPARSSQAAGSMPVDSRLAF